MVKVNLISFTQDAIPLMCYMRRIMHSPVPDTLKELKEEPKKWLGMSTDEYFETVLLKDKMPTFLESVNMFFKIEGVSRALQQQLTRTRIASYSIQSLRCINLPNFADKKEYHNPYRKNSEQYVFFHNKMLNLQKDYRELLKKGINTQDARGILPMNIYSTIGMSISLRSLTAMINKRLCLKTQGEFRDLAALLSKEITEKIDVRLSKFIGAPCDLYGKCMLEGENEEQYKEGLFSGKQNTDHVCPKYIKKFKQ